MICAKAVGIAGLVMVVSEFTLALVEFIQAAAECPDPKNAASILVDRENDVIFQAGWFTGVISIVNETIGLRAKAIQAFVGTHPERF